MNRLRQMGGTVTAILLSGVLVAGCGGSKSSSGKASVAVNATAPSTATEARTAVINVARSSDATSLNPQELNIGEDYTTQEAIYAGLVRPSADGKTIEGDLASSWTYDESSLTYTFKLRPGLKFSDGTPIGTADVIYSIEQAKKGAEYAPMFAAVEKISAPSSSEIEIKLSKYSNLVLPALSFALVVPNDLRGKKPLAFYKNPVTSGEYSLVSWEPGTKMVLERNPNYWDVSHVLNDRIVFQVITEENARLNALQAGNAQLDEYVPDEQVPALSSDQLVENGPRSAAVLISTNNGRPPFTNIADREAASLAINRELILKTIWKGAGVPNQGLIPRGLPQSHATPTGQETWEYDPTKAKALLHGTHPSITLLTSYERGIDSSLVDAVQQELTAVDFHVTPEVKDFATLANQVFAGKFTILLTPEAAYLPTAGEAITTYATLFAQFAHWDVKTAEKYLAQFAEAKTLQQQKAVVLAFERWAHVNYFASPIGSPSIYFGVSPKLRGLRVTPFGTYRLGALQLAK